MGRAHSGTTILDCLLDNIEGVQGCGELAVGLPRLSKPTGDLPPGVSPFWNQVRSDYKSQNHDMRWDEAVQAIYRHAHIFSLPATWIKPRNSPTLEKATKSTIYISRSIRNVSNNSVVVESSKELSRGILISRFIKGAKIIHLVRDPVKVVSSTLHRVRHRHGFRFMRRNFQSKFFEPIFIIICSLGWLIGNLICELAKKKYPNNFITVKFENLKGKHDTTLKKIGGHIGKDTSQIRDFIDQSDPILIGNQISGNKILENESIIFGNGSKRSLPVFYKLLCKLITSPLLKTYGYRE